jgi:hypothetical protein
MARASPVKLLVFFTAAIAQSRQVQRQIIARINRRKAGKGESQALTAIIRLN